MNTADEIISKLYEFYGVSNDNQLSKELGLKSNSSISNWRKSGIIPEKWKNIYSENMSKIKQKRTNENNNLITVNLYEDIYASAGYGNLNCDIEPIKMQFDKNFLTQVFNITRFDKLDIIRVVGDSMLPLIYDGEYIILDRTDNVKSGDTVVAIIDGELYVKLFKKIPYEKTIILESHNKDYPSINIDTDEKLDCLKIIGIVKSKIKLY